MRYFVGIDEAGRGALAGPVSVGAVMIPVRFHEWALFEGLRDSKQLTAPVREEWFQKIKTDIRLRYSFGFMSAKKIDDLGIVRAIAEGAANAISGLSIDPRCTYVLLDKGLSVPECWTQKQIIKGDEQEVSIALASIVAKVLRDRRMRQIDRKHPEYGFKQHKGYGTKIHCQRIIEHGLNVQHREYFCTNILANRYSEMRS